MLINVKMPTIVCILTFMSMINTTHERFKARKFLIFRYLSLYEQLKFCAQLSLALKKVLTSGPDIDSCILIGDFCSLLITLRTVWTQINTIRMSFFSWIQTV